MKYVMLQEQTTGSMHPVLFFDHLTHSIVAHGICREYRREKVFLNPISAGFWDEEQLKVHGRSESLNMESVKTDAYYIALGGAVSNIPVGMVEEIAKVPFDAIKKGKGVT